MACTRSERTGLYIDGSGAIFSDPQCKNSAWNDLTDEEIDEYLKEDEAWKYTSTAKRKINLWTMLGIAAAVVAVYYLFFKKK